MHSTPLIFAFRQDLAPDVIMTGCCGFAGPFPSTTLDKQVSFRDDTKYRLILSIKLSTHKPRNITGTYSN